VEAPPPEGCAGEKAFWVAKKAKMRERRAAGKDKMRRKCFIEAKLASPSMLDEKNDRWDALILTTKESSGEESSDDE
jgi:hypothetical protein